MGDGLPAATATAARTSMAVLLPERVIDPVLCSERNFIFDEDFFMKAVRAPKARQVVP
jgi:hypothetical protein